MDDAAERTLTFFVLASKSGQITLEYKFRHGAASLSGKCTSTRSPHHFSDRFVAAALLPLIPT